MNPQTVKAGKAAQAVKATKRVAAKAGASSSVSRRKDTQSMKAETGNPDKLRFEYVPTYQQTLEPPKSLPKTIDELPFQNSFSYDVSIETALKLNIPVMEKSGSASSRILVLERMAYTRLPIETNDPKMKGAIGRYGYVLRMIVSVKRAAVNVKMSIATVAAHAQINALEASWQLQVIGVAGEKIDKLILSPSELDAKTLVVAQQSLEKLTEAVRTATFLPQEIGLELPRTDTDFDASVGAVFAIARAHKGVVRKEALKEVDKAPDEFKAAVKNAYIDLTGVDDEASPISAKVFDKIDAMLKEYQLKSIDIKS